MRIAVPFVASLVLLVPSLAAAWSSAAHQAIAQAALDRLDPAPRKALAKILQGTNVLSPGVLASVAAWPDDVRARAQYGTISDQWTSADIAEADQFNAPSKLRPMAFRGSVNELPTRFDCAIAVPSTTDNAAAAAKSSFPRR